ncbi:carcinoembryonic antigen-related cell adhesion molecule 3-like [Dendropsophus ebraccatus]|uniref:carcinoembryonic antigen-related cell adhesion molecule 3-like n=1 Tax=Dendropsophus ebraccatus TaxID=150705 RepID=UPI0038312398
MQPPVLKWGSQRASEMNPAPLPSPLRLCLYVLLIGLSGTLHITVPIEPIQGIVGDSILLPVTYSIAQPPSTLQVVWSHEKSLVLFSEMTMRVRGEPPKLEISNEYHVLVGRYHNRAVFYPENASLLLRNVQRNDSGRYTVTFEELNQSRSMMLIIHDPEAASSDPELSGSLHITVPTVPIQGIVGESILLPVTYSFAQPPATLQVMWGHEKSMVLFSEMTTCVRGEPPKLEIINEYHVLVGKYQDRVVFYPENASLLLRNVQQNDSGRYTITFQELNQSRSMMLIIHDPETASSDPVSTQNSCEEDDDRQCFIQSLAVRAICAAIFALLVMALHCTWWRQTRTYRTEVI